MAAVLYVPMSGIGERLKESRLNKGLTQEQLATACGWDGAGRVSNYEKGRREPNAADMATMAAALGVSASWLWTGQGSPDAGMTVLPVGTRVPLVNWPTLGAESGLYLPPANDGEWRFCPVTCGPRTFAVRVPVTDAMMAVGATSYPPGCIIYIDPDQLDPPHGKPVLAKLESTGEIVFKVFMTEAGRTWLRSLNPAYPAIHGGFRVVGTIIGKWEDS